MSRRVRLIAIAILGSIIVSYSAPADAIMLKVARRTISVIEDGVARIKACGNSLRCLAITELEALRDRMIAMELEISRHALTPELIERLRTAENAVRKARGRPYDFFDELALTQ